MPDEPITDGERAHRVTNQDIDRRVGNLETVQGQHGDRLHELGNEIAVVKLQVEHSQELMRAKFEQVLSSAGSSAEKLDRLIERMNSDTRHADLEASPAGRLVKEQLSDHENRLRRLTWLAGGATAIIALLVVLMPLIAPLLQQAMRLPS